MVPGARPGSFHVSNSSMKKVLLLPLFTDEETEARRPSILANAGCRNNMLLTG